MNKAKRIKVKIKEKQPSNVIKLPCKLGDIVYRINKTELNITKHKVYTIYIREDAILICYETLSRGFNTYENVFNAKEFGKTVFFDFDEALKKLNEYDEALRKIKDKEQP